MVKQLCKQDGECQMSIIFCKRNPSLRPLRHLVVAFRRRRNDYNFVWPRTHTSEEKIGYYRIWCGHYLINKMILVSAFDALLELYNYSDQLSLGILLKSWSLKTFDQSASKKANVVCSLRCGRSFSSISVVNLLRMYNVRNIIMLTCHCNCCFWTFTSFVEVSHINRLGCMWRYVEMRVSYNLAL